MGDPSADARNAARAYTRTASRASHFRWTLWSLFRARTRRRTGPKALSQQRGVAAAHGALRCRVGRRGRASLRAPAAGPLRFGGLNALLPTGYQREQLSAGPGLSQQVSQAIRGVLTEQWGTARRGGDCRLPCAPPLTRPTGVDGVASPGSGRGAGRAAFAALLPAAFHVDREGGD